MPQTAISKQTVNGKCICRLMHFEHIGYTTSYTTRKDGKKINDKIV